MANANHHRIISLIPSATEIVELLGLQIVGRSHECDYPSYVKDLPICTEPKFDPEGTSIEIHERVSKILMAALSVYRVKLEVLEALKPTHILTQAQCEVCAVSLGDVETAVDQLTGSHPKVISLQPNLLADVWDDIARVAAVLEVPAEAVLKSLQLRVDACREKASMAAKKPTVACIEWIEPLMAAGNWVPELVALAGGENLFGVVGEHSPWLKAEALFAADPEIIIFMPCGFDIERTRSEAFTKINSKEWQSLQAVQHKKVFVVDGNQYFNRPGPRLVDSLEILAEIFHPELFPAKYAGFGWQTLNHDH
jgi:iron complex transport system substrate-binding protein